MRHRLIRFWPVLWQQFGVRPMDIEHLTIVEVVALEGALADWERKNR